VNAAARSLRARNTNIRLVNGRDTSAPSVFVPTEEFKAELRAIYIRHGGVLRPAADGDRLSKLAWHVYDTDLNGYKGIRRHD
jgi:hypothetical protein